MAEQDQTVVIHGMSWRTYVLLNDAIDQATVKVGYHRGDLEIMTRGPRHEIVKKLLARLLELWALDSDVALYAYGETTFRGDLEDAGIEPDECYTVGHPLERVPDLALEVVMTHGALDKLPIYRALGVGEVWIFERGTLSVHVLGRGGYRAAKRSRLLPALDVRALGRHANMLDQHAAVKSFRDALRTKRKTKRKLKR